MSRAEDFIETGVNIVMVLYLAVVAGLVISGFFMFGFGKALLLILAAIGIIIGMFIAFFALAYVLGALWHGGVWAVNSWRLNRALRAK